MTITVNVGDKVIDIYGKEGHVKEICKCSRCEERGWFEPVVEFSDQTTDWINDYDKKCGFTQYYQIGENIFPDHLHRNDLNLHLHDTIESIQLLTNQAENLHNMMKILDQQRDVL